MIEIGHCPGNPDSIFIDETTAFQTHAHKHPQITCIQKDNRKDGPCIEIIPFPVTSSISDSHSPSLYITVWLQANIIAVLFISA